jgi:predicted nucleic acid-binding protein
MRLLLVTDANVIIAATLRDSTTRGLLLRGDVLPVAPRMVIAEIEKHIYEISAKNSLPVETNRRVLRLLANHIRILPLRAYKSFLLEAYATIGERDPTDVPYLAVALTVDADGIWSNDADFAAQNRFRVWSTAQLRELLCGGPGGSR